MIRRKSKKKNFTVLDNDLLNDTSLDWDELGKLVYLLSKADDTENLDSEELLGRRRVHHEKCST